MKRRLFLQATAGALATSSLGACSVFRDTGARVGGGALSASIPRLVPYQASPDRIIAMDVCTRPFREQGPRIESERRGGKTVVHNYGHGGSGWSLSWGSGALATELALAAGSRDIAVVGCGAIGLTTALVAQRAGLKVTIYARERPPYVRSSYATGIWSPDSRICTLEHAPAFADRWERMARISHRRFHTLLGLTDHPVEWRDHYFLSDRPFGSRRDHGDSNEPDYPHFSRDLAPDLRPRPVDLSSAAHPFPVKYLRRSPLMLFNIGAYSRLLTADFIRGGGRIETFELKDASDFNALNERTIINCTGYDARRLMGDDSIIPVRGQTCKLVSQPAVNYGIYYVDAHLGAYPRRDGLVVQSGADTDFGNPEANIDPKESTAAVQRLGEIMAPLVEAEANT